MSSHRSPARSLTSAVETAVANARQPLLPRSCGHWHRWFGAAVMLVVLAVGQLLPAQCPSVWLEGDGFDMRGSTTQFGPKVRALVVLPNGDLVAAGDFDVAGGTAVHGVARWDGSRWIAMGTPPFPVNALVVMPNGVLVAGGEGNGGVASWNGTTWSLLGGGLPQSGFSPTIVNRLVVLPNANLVAGGDFFASPSGPRNIALWNGSTWSDIGGGTALPVTALTIHNGYLVAGCTSNFAFYGEVLRWGGPNWTTLGVVTGNAGSQLVGVSTLAVLPNGDLVASGVFTAVGSVPVTGAAQWNGSAWSPTQFGGVLAVFPNGNLVNGYQEWNGASWSPLGSGPNGRVRALVVLQNGQLVAGGDFTSTDDVEACAIARWDCPLGFAAHGTFGVGCYHRTQSFYDGFGPSGLFDLSNSTIRMTLIASSGPTAGYSVDPGAGTPTFFTPISPDLGLGAWECTPTINLPFNIPYPGGTTNQIVICTNGFLFLQPDTGGVLHWLSGTAALAPLNSAMNPGTGSGGGTVHVDIDTANQVVYASWMNIQDMWTPSLVSTFQVAMFASGTIEYRYLNCAVFAGGAMTGWSAGGGARDPGERDLSAAAPFQTVPDCAPLVHTASRPVIGTTVTLNTTDMPSSSSFGATSLGWTQHNPGIELTALGMPGCFQYAGADVFTMFVPTAGVGSYSFAIPNMTPFVGMHLFTQGAAFAPGFNPLGVLSSNGVFLVIGHP